MLVNTLEPQNILLLNFYLIPLLQILFNWNAGGCGTNSNIWQLFFVLILISRVFIDQLYNNAHIKQRPYQIIMLLTSGVGLLIMGIYESWTIAAHPDAFVSKICYQNRIVYVAECAICFLILIKDIIFVAFGKKDVEEAL